jgi:hypothetical protein
MYISTQAQNEECIGGLWPKNLKGDSTWETYRRRMEDNIRIVLEEIIYEGVELIKLA